MGIPTLPGEVQGRRHFGGLLYGYNPHSDIETLTSEGGDTRSTYGYTAYGKNDEDRFTGVDKPESQNPGKSPTTSTASTRSAGTSRRSPTTWASATIHPGLNRFLTRDAYSGALADLNLSTDPWNANRYAFAGGNPISRVEIDGHIAIDEEGNRVPAGEPTPREVPLRKDLECGSGNRRSPEGSRERRETWPESNSERGRRTDRQSPCPEVWNILGRPDRTGAVQDDLKARGVHAQVESNFQKIAANPAVKAQAGAQFDAPADPRNPNEVYRGGGRFFGRTLGVLGVVGDLQYVWEAGRVMSGKQPNPDLYADGVICLVMACPTVS